MTSTAGPLRRVVLLSAADTLPGVGASARRLGVVVRRLEAIRPRELGAEPWRRLARRQLAFDTVVLTSRHAVGARFRAWARSRPPGSPPLELWAAGPGTAARARAAGVGPIRRARAVGAAGLVAALRGRRRTVLRVRSDAAGPSLARELRAGGHRVVDVIGYRLEARPAVVRRHREAVRGSAGLVATSPSGLRALRAGLGVGAFRAVTARTPVVVLGDRSARAARALGFRRVAVAAPSTPQRFARELVRALDDARD